MNINESYYIEMGNEKLKKTLVTISTVTVVGLGSVFFSTPASADTLNDLKSKETQIQQDREDLKGNLSAAESEIADLLIDLEKINEEIERVTKALEENKATLKKNEEDISNTQSEVDKLEEEIVQLEEAIEKRFEILKERAAAYQKNGGNISYIEVLFGSKSFGDFISRVTAINKITDSDAALMEQIEEDKEKVEEKQNEVLAKLDELKEMNVELEGMQALIKDQQKENKAKKATLKEKEATLVAKVEELEIKDSKLASLEKEVKQNIKELTQPVQVAQVASESVDNSSNNDGNLNTLSETKDNSSVSAPAPSGGVSTAMNAGFAHLGTPYVWGGKGPGGFDCSGFVSWAFAQGGISLPSSTAGLQSVGTKVSASNMQPGDIVFFNTYKTNGHVGIYLGGGKFIGAQNSTGLAVADMSSGYWAGKFAGHVRSVR
ncbi:C40 family peptidase [Ralstonia pickettii]|nr:C40 family peptidase [Ralstonia pickettii]